MKTKILIIGALLFGIFLPFFSINAKADHVFSYQFDVGVNRATDEQINTFIHDYDLDYISVYQYKIDTVTWVHILGSKNPITKSGQSIESDTTLYRLLSTGTIETYESGTLEHAYPSTKFHILDATGQSIVNSTLQGSNNPVYHSNGTISAPDGSNVLVDDGNGNSGLSFFGGRYMLFDLGGTHTVTAIGLQVLTRKEKYDVYFYANDDYTNLITSVNGSVLTSSYTVYTPVNIKGVKSVKLVGSDSSANNLNHFAIHSFEDVSTKPPLQELEEINSVLNQKDHESVTFNYTIPESNNFSHIKIYRDEVLIKDNHTGSTFKDTGLTPDTTYNYKFVSYGMDGSKTAGREVSVKTNELPIMDDVTNLKASTTETSISLNYTFPESPNFSHVEIYRDGELIKDNHKESSYLDEGLQVETEHTYKIVAVSLEGIKSSGVSIKAETNPYNKEFTDLVKEEKEEDFVFTWSTPESGQVKVFIAGKEYTTVAADQKSVSIPKSEMKYDIYDQPLVTLQAIAPDGKEGPITKPENVSEGSPIEKAKDMLFKAKDVLFTGMNLLKAVGGFILLGMAFFFQDSLLGLVRTSFRLIRGWGGSE